MNKNPGSGIQFPKSFQRSNVPGLQANPTNPPLSKQPPPPPPPPQPSLSKPNPTLLQPSLSKPPPPPPPPPPPKSTLLSKQPETALAAHSLQPNPPLSKPTKSHYKELCAFVIIHFGSNPVYLELEMFFFKCYVNIPTMILYIYIQ